MKHLIIILLLSFTSHSQCEYILWMDDSQLSGWNGSYITINVNGIPTFGPYFSSLGLEVDTFTVSNSDIIEVVYTAGIWEPDEFYWLVLDGNTIFADGQYPDTGSVFIDTCNVLSVFENEKLINKKLIRITDLIGRESEDKPNTTLIYIYSDGTTEKVYRME